MDLRTMAKSSGNGSSIRSTATWTPDVSKSYGRRIMAWQRPRTTQTRPRRSSRRRSEEHTSELQSRENLVCRLLLEKKEEITEAGRIDPASNESEAFPSSGREPHHLHLRKFLFF